MTFTARVLSGWGSGWRQQNKPSSAIRTISSAAPMIPGLSTWKSADQSMVSVSWVRWTWPQDGVRPGGRLIWIDRRRPLADIRKHKSVYFNISSPQNNIDDNLWFYWLVFVKNQRGGQRRSSEGLFQNQQWVLIMWFVAPIFLPTKHILRPKSEQW